MIVSIDVEDEAWNKIAGLEALARRACEAASAKAEDDAEVTLLFTSDAEIAALNAQWRGKSGPTNVLSFPAPANQPRPPGEPKLLGDIVLAFGRVTDEAAAQGKDLESHVTHLIVHGYLHLLGYDHTDEAQAEEMEALEIGILAGLGIENPYLENHERH